MTREEDIKKIISIIIVITIILAVFIGVRVLNKDDVSSKSPNITVTPTPDVPGGGDISLDPEEDVTEGEKTDNSNDDVKVENMNNYQPEVEVIVPIQPDRDIEVVEPADKILLRESVLEASSFIENLEVDENIDLDLVVLLGELEKTLDEVNEVFENVDAYQEEVDKAKEELDKALKDVKEYILALESGADVAVTELEKVISLLTLEEAQKLTNSLPLGDVRDNLLVRIQTVTDQMIVPAYSTVDPTKDDVLVTIKVVKEFLEELEGWTLIDAEEGLYQRAFSENTTDTLVPIRYVDGQEEYVSIVIENIDKEAPTTTLVDGFIYNDNVILDFSDVNEINEIKVLKDGVETTVVDNTLTEEGQYKVIVNDILGNEMTIEFSIDKKGIIYVDSNSLPVDLLIGDTNEIFLDKTTFTDLELTVLLDNSKTLKDVEYVLVDNNDLEEKIIDDLNVVFLEDKLEEIKEIKININYEDITDTYRLVLN